jgi:hypothetical protein
LSAPTLTGSNQSSTIPSLASTGNSTPLGSLRRMSQTVDQSDHFSRRGKSYLSAPEDDEPWGHFIDIAEADDEIVRHSRILSAKEMYYRHNQWVNYRFKRLLRVLWPQLCGFTIYKALSPVTCFVLLRSWQTCALTRLQTLTKLESCHRLLLPILWSTRYKYSGIPSLLIHHLKYKVYKNRFANI